MKTPLLLFILIFFDFCHESDDAKGNLLYTRRDLILICRSCSVFSSLVDCFTPGLCFDDVSDWIFYFIH